MKSSLPVLALAAFMLGGCASSGGKSAAEATPGKFVTYACEGGKSFSVRFDAENSSARIRTHDGAFELAKGDRGLFRDDEWILSLTDANGTELVHKSKAQYKNCAAK
jgi:hypothetical protein